MRLGERAFLGRTGALAILAVLVLAFLFGPVALYADLLVDNAAQIDTKEQLLARYRGLAREKLPTGAVGSADALLFFPELPDSQAVALLQEALKNAAAAAQVQVQGFQVLRSEPMPGSVRIGVRLRATAEIGGLERLLYAIESARPVLHPDNLQIQSHAVRPAAASSALDFQLDVSGFKVGPAT